MMGIFRAISRGLERLDLGGWLMMLSGFAMIAAATLIPAWEELRQMTYQRDVLHTEELRMEEYNQNYLQFVQAVKANNPELMERLARHRLNLKPRGTQLLDSPAYAMGKPQRYEEWIIPKPAVHPPPPKPLAGSKLVRYSTGANRPWFILAGGVLILTSLLLRLHTPTLDPDDDDVVEDAQAQETESSEEAGARAGADRGAGVAAA